jgi:hypothetical protein
VTAAPVVTGDGAGGIVSLVIDGIDAGETGSVGISSPAGETVRVAVSRNQTRLEVPSYRVGSNSASLVTVTPYSRFDLPPGLGGSTSGGVVTVQANGIGSPLSPQLTLSAASNGDGTSTITARGSATRNGDGSALRYGIVQEGRRCAVIDDGETATFPGLEDGEEYAFRMCVESWWDDEVFGRAETTATVRAHQSGRAPEGWTFVVDARPDVQTQRADWIIRADPTSTERLPNRNRAEFSGWGPGTTIFGRDPVIQVRYVHEVWGTSTGWSSVTPRAGSAPYQLQATWEVASCVGGSPLVPRGQSSNAPDGSSAAISFGNAGLRFYDDRDQLLTRTADSWDVPVGAVRVEGVAVSVSWDAQGWGLSPASAEFSARCQPNNGAGGPGSGP